MPQRRPRRRGAKRRSAATSSPTTRRSPPGRPTRCPTRRGPAAGDAGGGGRPARPVPAHPVLAASAATFCYFRVYTDKNAAEVQVVPRRAGPRVGAVRRAAGHRRAAARLHLLRGRNAVVPVGAAAPRPGRPALGGSVPWSTASEITFECEPGTLTESKLRAIREMGVTRLSLGVEHFDDHVLELNGRAHRSAEILPGLRVRPARFDFPQINIDLIAGMLGETDEKWQDAVPPDGGARIRTASPSTRWSCRSTHDDQRPIGLHGTGQFQGNGGPMGDQAPLGWTRRSARWNGAGYTVASAYTGREAPRSHELRVPRFGCGRGADLVGLGRGVVRTRQRRPHAEPGLVGAPTRRPYKRGRIPLKPGLPTHGRGTPDSASWLLQLKLGSNPARLLPGQVRRGTCANASHTRSRHWPPTATWPSRTPERGPPVARGPATRRQPAAAFLSAGAHRHPVHVGAHGSALDWFLNSISWLHTSELERDLKKLGVEIKPSYNIEPPFGRRPTRIHNHSRSMSRNS